ncbi:MAG TPA: amino acid permease [Bryobacteraceae bacterium]|nr:amino acid permease [Bryobacteraceae bacterium]
MSQLLRTKSIDDLIEASLEPAKSLRRTLGPYSLTALGIGAVIGSGIFTVTGTAAAGKVLPIRSALDATLLDLMLHGVHAGSQMGRPGAGPALTLSFILVGLACCFAALCYAELASMIPIAGSAYTYAYATLGEIFAWIIGWDLILEYAVSNMSVAVGFSAYLQDLFENVLGFHLPAQIAFAPIPAPGQPAGWFNLPALIITIAVTWILTRGVKESAETNAAMVIVKLIAILAFCLGAARAINPAHWRPFAPNGFPGILTGASIIFFSYIGFDSVSTAAEECRHPQRDLPIGIIATLVICTVLYASVSLVLTGIVPWRGLGTDSPVADALKALGFNRLRLIVTAGALMGMLSSLLVYQYGQARIWFAMSRDGLLPRMFSAVHRRFKTPHVSTWIAGFAVGIPAGIWDIDTFAELSNIGTLFAFIIVSAGVIVLRRRQPHRRRAFRVPCAPLFPAISIVCCLVLMMGLPLLTWLRFLSWLGIGLTIYFLYSKTRSLLAQEMSSRPAP